MDVQLPDVPPEGGENQTEEQPFELNFFPTVSEETPNSRKSDSQPQLYKESVPVVVSASSPNIKDFKFIRVSVQLLPLVTCVLDDGKKVSQSELLLIAYVAGFKNIGDGRCHELRDFIAVNLGMSPARISSMRTRLSRCGLLDVDTDKSMRVDEDAVARVLDQELAADWMRKGYFLRIPLWYLASEGSTPSAALVFGDIITANLLTKKRKPLSNKELAEELYISKAILSRALEALSSSGLIVCDEDAQKHRRAYTPALPKNLGVVGKQLDNERLGACESVLAVGRARRNKSR